MAFEFTMSIRPTFVPSPGTTITPVMLHRIIDEAVIDVYGLVTNTGRWDVFDDRNTSYQETVQYIDQDEIAVGHSTQVSMSGTLFHHLHTKGGVAYWIQGDGGVGTMTEGMPAFNHYNLGPNNCVSEFSTRFNKKNSTDGYNFPVLNGDLKAPASALETQEIGGKEIPFGFPAFVLAAQDTTGTISAMEVIYQGEATALIHVGYSTSFNVNDLYAIHHRNVGGKWYQFPISWDGTNTGVTQPNIPYGVIRSITTTATTVQSPYLSTTNSLAAQEYYVAKIFFWGEPCL